MTPLCLHRLDTVVSTNDEAMRLLRAGAPDGTVVWAMEQTGGRGRTGRAWQSPAGNLYISVVARLSLPAPLSGRIAVTCGRAVASALGTETGLPVRTKWPNDLYLDGRKLGGILVETLLGTGGMVQGAVAGLGVNLASHPEVTPPGVPATDLAEHGIPQAPEAWAVPLAACMVAACHDATRPDWLEWVGRTDHLELARGPVRVRAGAGAYDADAAGLGADGALMVVRDGSLLSIADAEVSVRIAQPPAGR